MFQRIRDHIESMRTVRRLCESAEAHARARGERMPGAEHLLLAALDLPDGSARRAFERAGADPSAIPAAIEAQYRAALEALGLDARLPPAAATSAAQPRLYQAQPSAQELLQAVAQSRKGQPGPLRGAHVVAMVADMPLGVAARTLRLLGLDAAQLAMAARAEAGRP